MSSGRKWCKLWSASMLLRSHSRITLTFACLLAGVAPFLSRTTGAQAQTIRLPAAATGADVDESRVQKTLYVDAGNGEAADDDKHGTAEAPFATLRYACQAAAAAKDAGLGVKLVLASGTYRETAEVPGPAQGKKDTEATLVIEAAEHDQAIIDGADAEGWSASTWKIENGRWTHPWAAVRAPRGTARGASSSRTADAAAGDAAQRGDFVLVNDTALRQVNTEAELVPGSFWISKARAAGKGSVAASASVVVQPPEGVELAGAIVQVSARAYGLRIDGRRNVVVRGVMCQHAANPSGVGAGEIDMAGLQISGCANVLVEDVLTQWNDGAGIHLAGDADVTLRRVRTLHNGALGILAESMKNLLAEDCEVSFNRFRAEWAGRLEPAADPAGFQTSAELGAFRRLHVIGNSGRGGMLSGTNLMVEDAVIQGNALSGLWLQHCAGPVMVRRCVVAGTRGDVKEGRATGATGGIVLTKAREVTLESNVVANNVTAQVVEWESAGDKGSVRSELHRYRHNVVSGEDGGELAFLMEEEGRSKGPGAAADYFQTLEADENDYWNPTTEAVFTVTGPTGATPAVAMTLAQWQLLLKAHVAGQTDPAGKVPEGRSVWLDPQFVGAADGDYRVRAEALADWNLPAGEATGGP